MKSMMTFLALGSCMGFFALLGIGESLATRSVIAKAPSEEVSPYRKSLRFSSGAKTAFFISVDIHKFVSIEKHKAEVCKRSGIRIHLMGLLVGSVVLERG